MDSAAASTFDPLYILWIVLGVLAIVGIVALVYFATHRSSREPRSPIIDAVPARGDEELLPDGDQAPQVDAPTTTLERPEALDSRWMRLRARLASSGAIGNALLSVLSRGSLTEEDWEEIEETLLMADLGLGPTTELMDTLRREAKVLDTSDPAAVRAILRRELLALVEPGMDRTLDTTPGGTVVGRCRRQDGAPGRRRHLPCRRRRAAHHLG